MDKTQEEIIATITKCMKLANDPRAPQGEREAARGKMVKLMVKYDIDQATFTMNESEEDMRKRIVMLSILMDKPGVKSHDTFEREILASEVAKFYNCRAVVQGGSRSGGGDEFVMVMGFKHDAEMVGPTYAQLSLLMVSESFKVWGETGVGKDFAKDFPVHARSFAQGFVSRIAERLEELTARRKYAEKHVDVGDTSLALVLVKKEDMLAEKFKEEFPDVGRLRSPKQSGYNHESAARGRQVANSADIGEGKVQSGARGELRG